ncbi:MAG TPA: hypothetical protein VF411_01835, partial [Bacteroidia bacterium]
LKTNKHNMKKTFFQKLRCLMCGGSHHGNGGCNCHCGAACDGSCGCSCCGTACTSFKLMLSANQIKTGNTTPIDIPELVAPGVGYAWSVVSAELHYSFNNAPFTSTTAFLTSDTASIEQMVSGVVLNSLSSSFSKFLSTGSSDVSMIENKKVSLVINADSTVGDGTAIVYGMARKVKL